MSYLVDCFHAENRANGHAYNCSYGAGADCDCGRHRRPEYEDEIEAERVANCEEILVLYVVTALVNGKQFVIDYFQGDSFTTVEQVKSRASTAVVRGGWKGVKITRRSVIRDSREHRATILRCEFDMERLADWATD